MHEWETAHIWETNSDCDSVGSCRMLTLQSWRRSHYPKDTTPSQRQAQSSTLTPVLRISFPHQGSCLYSIEDMMIWDHTLGCAPKADKGHYFKMANGENGHQLSRNRVRRKRWGGCLGRDLPLGVVTRFHRKKWSWMKMRRRKLKNQLQWRSLYELLQPKTQKNQSTMEKTKLSTLRPKDQESK